MNNESKGYDRPDRDSTTPQANFVCVVQLALANLRAAIECNDRDYQSLKESYNRQAEEIYSLQAAAAHRALVMDGLRDELRQARQQIEYLQAMNRGGPPYVSPGLTD